MSDPATDRTETKIAPVTSPNPKSMPWYLTCAIAIGICMVSCSFLVDEFWDLLQKRPGIVIGTFLGSLAMIPVAAVIALGIFRIRARSNKEKYAYSDIFLVTLGIIFALFYVADKYGKESRQQGEAKRSSERERAMAASTPSDEEMKKILLFDGAISWKESSGSDRRYLESVSGRIRNETSKPLSSVNILVAFMNSEGKVIETFEFWPQEISQYEPLAPGHAIGFTHKKFIDRLPKDAKWQWGLRSARFSEI